MIDYDTYINKGNSLYVYGKTKTGKTMSILNHVNQNEYHYTYTTIQQIKNEYEFYTLLESQNVYNMFYKKKTKDNKKKIIIIDNIDFLQTIDKKILNTIIKCIKYEKEKYPKHFFIFIGTNLYDKKVVELMEYVNHTHEMKSLTSIDYNKVVKDMVKDYLTTSNHKVHGMNDKNIISLCYHENIIYHIDNDSHYYESFLEHFCEGDYFDRLSFQKQLWQFNEMTFFLKVILNYINYQKKSRSTMIETIDFTKILTKFSNEYSNLNFIIQMCHKINCQKEELYNGFKENKPLMYSYSAQERKRIMKLMT